MTGASSGLLKPLRSVSSEMNAPLHLRPHSRFAVAGPVRVVRRSERRALGARLVDAGLLDPGDLAKALSLQVRENARLGEILTAHKMVHQDTVMEVLAEQADIPRQSEAFDIAPELRTAVSVADCLAFGFAPIRHVRGATYVAITHPDRIRAVERKLPERFGHLNFVLVAREALHGAIARAYPQRMIANAEARPPDERSCRTGLTLPQRLSLASVILVAIQSAVTLPLLTLQVLLGIGVVTLMATMILKLACLLTALRHLPDQTADVTALRLPKFSILVPLYKESGIAATLVKRLKKISYPAELIEIFLVLEEDDQVTRDCIAHTRLPRHFHAITVPTGTLKTKPRALNYALDFTDGEIIGVYDAEDAPAPYQLHDVARAFAQDGSDLACVQGILSFYNWSRNWLARCFFFEYASWFRVMLPGLSRLGFAIPLGGTTLFFRRSALLDLGGWDAHNVTEDADLGIRLARYGYRTQMISSVTEEEANCRVWPWIKQRSRWLKGYAVTWAVHMRRPCATWRALGPKKFLGFQVLFLGTLTSFFLAPAFWITSGLLVSGVMAPAQLGLSKETLLTLSAIFLVAEALNLSLFWVAGKRVKERPSLLWIFTLPVYFTFASVAAYKAFFELWYKPFFWDKTRHGSFGGVVEAEASDLGELARIDLQAHLEGDREVVP